MIRVNSGVRELSIPARLLSICVCALVNRYAGIPFPMTPTIMSDTIFFLLIFRILLKRNGVRNKKVKNIRKEATWLLVYDSRPFFIKINEVPQIKARKSNNAHCHFFLFRYIDSNFNKDSFISRVRVGFGVQDSSRMLRALGKR